MSIRTPGKVARSEKRPARPVTPARQAAHLFAGIPSVSRLNDRFFRQLIFNLRNGVMAITREGRVAAMNDIAYRVLGLPPRPGDIGRPLWGLVVGHTLVAVPYVLRTTLAVLHDFDRRIEEAAAVLGAPPARVFREVTLPLIRPGVMAGGIFAFIVSFDQFPISLFLVVPNGETLPVVLFNYIRFDLDGAIAAASMVSIALALAVVFALERLIGLRAYVRL